MLDSERRDFRAVIQATGMLYEKQISDERIVMYWEALKHRSLTEIKSAINTHVQAPVNGRFFPLPADIAAALPAALNAWLTADEAWAMAPKDESSSAALCDEISTALGVAKDLIDSGDKIAARRAFIDHYNRLSDEAKKSGRNPKWWPSYGHNKAGRYIADAKVVEMRNLALPLDQRLALPMPPPPEPLRKLFQADTRTGVPCPSHLRELLNLKPLKTTECHEITKGPAQGEAI